MWPHLNGCQPIAKVMYFRLDMQEKVTTIDEWLQLSSTESTRAALVTSRNHLGKPLCHRYLGWFTLKMQENRKGKRAITYELSGLPLSEEVSEYWRIMVNVRGEIGRDAPRGDASRENNFIPKIYVISFYATTSTGKRRSLLQSNVN